MKRKGRARKSKTHSVRPFFRTRLPCFRGTWRKSIRRSLWKMAMVPEVITPKTINRSQTAIPVRCGRLSKIADNTGKLVDETKKRIGPGDIVFKNLPRALAVRGEWQERKIAQVSKPPAINITPVGPGSAASGAGPCCCGQLPPGGGGHTNLQWHQFL
ncbi:tail fiber protein of prophage CP-933T [Escherichia coli]|uniref:Tail fiber protein of prophage CP-933T n=1 Tax=Escherichia coli TaxID=562 RepID=A0A376J6J4_ECOLX|nr:tail fiber protein of prophage CP-933T [Escherichia coli]